MYYMATEVYSWRVSSELKLRLEQEARDRKTSVASVLDTAAREWLVRSTPAESDQEAQRRLHDQARKHFGTLTIGDGPYTNVKVGEVI